MSHAVAKAMILRWLYISDVAETHEWIQASREIIVRKEMTTVDGRYIWGPWTVDLEAKSVLFNDNNGQLRGTIEEIPRTFSIVEEKVTVARPTPDSK